MPPIAIAAGIGAIGSIGGGLIANAGAKSAANSMNNASQSANDLQWRMYQQSRQDSMPWMNAGGAAVNALASYLGLTPQQLTGVSGQSGNGWGGGPNGEPLNPLYGGGGGQTYGGPLLGADGQPMWGGNTGNGMFDPRIGGQNHPFSSSDGPMNGAVSDGGIGLVDSPAFPPSGTGTGTGTPTSPAQGGGGAGSAQYGADPNFGSLMRDFGLSDFQKDPGYNFRMQEGAKALQRNAAAGGNLFSGATLKGMNRYNQDYASNEFSNAYNRYQTNRASKYNFLANLAGMGQVSANTIANNGTNTAGMMGQNTINAATNAANARVSGYGAIANGISGGLNNGLNAYYMNKILG